MKRTHLELMVAVVAFVAAVLPAEAAGQTQHPGYLG